MRASNVTVMPATINFRHNNIMELHRKKRTAGYARVSTDLEEQQTSYEAQVDYYTRHIKENPDWEFVSVYTDEGISATSTKKRDGFNRMIADALAGRIDLIITKSVSRFARNTVDTLTTVRQLKEKGVEVFFEKENILTLDSKGELLITIMSSLAQEESRSISENVTWGQRKRMADGKVSLPYAQFLGYEKGEDGFPKIVESEAKIIRLIYCMFLEGKTYALIAKHLTDSGIPTPAGKEVWCVSTIMSILQNEKFKGHALLQKGFTVDFLTKKKKVNEGEVPQYYVENSHPAIIAPETFDLVQSEIKRRKQSGRRLSSASPFSSKIVCGECGAFFGSKVWGSRKDDKRYRRTIWQCNAKYARGQRGKFCDAPHLTEDDIKAAFVEAFNQLVGGKEKYIAEYDAILPLIADTTALDKEAAKLGEERDVLMELIRKCVDDNARTAQDQEVYQEKFESLVARYEAVGARLEAIAEEQKERGARKSRICRFLDELRSADGLLAEFDEALWCALVDTVTVHKDGALKFTFKDGGEITVPR
ncbi:MAG: recombinase family protein [Oscillospiraceae bacterium]|jgi:DNA invertase Pin-like site-specific DNA recombinase|nr:recombinase family protein [Oscillospiraceae bacterium]